MSINLLGLALKYIQLPQVKLYPESIELIKKLKEKGVLLGLISGSRRNLIEKIWRAEGLAYFSTIISSDDTERFNPYPDPYLKAVLEIQQDPKNCLAIENVAAGINATISLRRT